MRGSTITEVLMALMIMGIGLVSLATLFPIAVLRAVKATQLTRATNLRYNAETMIDLYPRLIHNPDTNIDPRDPNFSFTTPRHNIDEDTNLNGTLENFENDGTFDNANGFLDRPNYIVDPLGWNSQLIPRADPNNYDPNFSLKDYFGNNGAIINPTPIRWLRRYNGGFIKEDLNGNGILDGNEDRNGNNILDPGLAENLTTLQDNWLVQYDAIPENFQVNPGVFKGSFVQLPAGINLDTLPISEDLNGNGIFDTGSNEVDLNNNGALDLGRSRITLFGGRNGRQSITRAIAGVDISVQAPKVFWTEPPAPSVLTTFTVERIRISSQDHRFTWMLTVRQAPDADPPEASVDLVVFTNRSFDHLDERVFPPPGVALTFPQAPANFPARSFVFQASRPDSNLIYVAYNPDPSISESPPAVKKGGYVLDVVNAIWYRIQDSREIATGTNIRAIEITIDRPAVADGTAAIFMQGIVEVFPLGSK